MPSGKSREQAPQLAFSTSLSGTRFLVGLCLVNFAMLVIINGALPLGVFGPPANLDAVLGVGGTVGALAFVQPWRLLSANVVHLGLLHLVLNIYALLSFGPRFEERFGGARLLLVVAFTGVVGFVVSTFGYGPFGPRTAGASASLFGLIGVEVALLAISKDPRAKETFFNYLFLAVALAIIMPVNNFAHFGGFAAGCGAGAVLHRLKVGPEPSRFSTWGALVVSGLLVLSVVLSLVALLLYRHSSP